MQEEKRRAKRQQKKLAEVKKSASRKAAESKKITLPASGKKVLTIAEKMVEDLRLWVLNMVNKMGAAIDAKFVEIADEFAAVRGGFAQHDSGIIVLQRVLNDAVSGSKVKTIKAHQLGRDVDLINWGWYVRQLDAVLALARFVNQVAVWEPEEAKKEPPLVEGASDSEIEDFGGDLGVTDPG